MGGIAGTVSPVSARVDISGSRRAEEPVVRLGVTARYDEIIVRGQPIVTCFSAGGTDKPLTPAWGTALEEAYKDGASGSSGYSTMTEDEKAEANDAYRASDRFDAVYTRFVLGSSFDWLGAFGDPICPESNPVDGTLRTNVIQHVFQGGKAFMRQLPLAKNLDYALSGSEIDAGYGDQGYRDPFVVVNLGGNWIYADRLAAATSNEVQNARIRMMDDALGLEIAFKPNHVLASADWSGAESSWVDPSLDWREMIATLAIECDNRVEVRMAVDPLGVTHEGVQRSLVIEYPGRGLLVSRAGHGGRGRRGGPPRALGRRRGHPGRLAAPGGDRRAREGVVRRAPVGCEDHGGRDRRPAAAGHRHRGGLRRGVRGGGPDPGDGAHVRLHQAQDYRRDGLHRARRQRLRRGRRHARRGGRGQA